MELSELFLRHVAPTSGQPLLVEIERAEGIYMFRSDGTALMDLICGISVSLLGHCHPEVVNAVQKQAANYMHTMVYGEFVLEPQVRFATQLAAILPATLDAVHFTNSGAEAVEGAIKLAKKLTSRYDIVAGRRAYHGTTHGTACLMSEPTLTQAYRPLLPTVRFIDFNDEDQLQIIDDRTACVVIETVQAARGLYIPEDGYLQKLARRCREVGALLILDEIQAGYGRTGHMFAFEAYDIVPDILCLAKGIGGGMPIATFIASRERMRALAYDPMLGHISTFSGHPVSCAAALATLDVLTGTDLIQQVPKKSALFLELLPHPVIREIRHCGLWFALELADEHILKRAMSLALEQGLLVDGFLFNQKTIRIAPPLIITETEIQEACAKLHQVFDQL